MAFFLKKNSTSLLVGAAKDSDSNPTEYCALSDNKSQKRPGFTNRFVMLMETLITFMLLLQISNVLIYGLGWVVFTTDY